MNELNDTLKQLNIFLDEESLNKSGYHRNITFFINIATRKFIERFKQFKAMKTHSSLKRYSVNSGDECYQSKMALRKGFYFFP